MRRAPVHVRATAELAGSCPGRPRAQQQGGSDRAAGSPVGHDPASEVEILLQVAQRRRVLARPSVVDLVI